jgi:metallo-beta-lactamase class B
MHMTKSNRGNAGRAIGLLAAGGVFAMAGLAFAQDTPSPVSAAPDRVRPAPAARQAAADYPRPATFPKENRAAVVEYLSQARKIAGADLFSDFAHRCIFSPLYRERTAGIQYDGYLQPTKIFDNLYTIGQVEVSAQALVTDAGIVIFDTLNSEDEAKNIIVPNLVKLGLNPADIKYIVITHEHGDHYGGARYLQETYGATVLASKTAWETMARNADRQGPGPFAGLPAPRHNIEISDDQIFRVGGTELHFYLTPGHTPGVLSTIFRVTDKGMPHLVGYYGGTGGGSTPESIRAQNQSLERWRKITAAAGVDVLIANHPLHDREIENNELLRYLKPGDSNPYVIGLRPYQRYMTMLELCGKVQLARLGVSD